jgi:hypothetical protein
VQKLYSIHLTSTVSWNSKVLSFLCNRYTSHYTASYISWRITRQNFFKCQASFLRVKLFCMSRFFLKKISPSNSPWCGSYPYCILPLNQPANHQRLRLSCPVLAQISDVALDFAVEVLCLSSTSYQLSFANRSECIRRSSQSTDVFLEKTVTVFSRSK